MASSKLSPKDVVLALNTLSEDKTKQLFYHLDLPFHIMSNIEAKDSGGMLTIRCVAEWINSDLEASWGKIVSALRQISMNKLAQELAIQHHVETPSSITEHLTFDPVTPSKSAQDSDGIQSPVDSETDPVQPLTSAVSFDHPTTDTTESHPNDPVTPVAPLVACSTDPIQRVQKEVEQLQDSFTDVMSMTRSAFCKKELQDSNFIDDFRDYLLFLPLSKKAPHVKFFRDSEDDIIQAKTVLKLLAILGRYCNYTNYDLLLHLINKFCSAAEKKRMQDYCNSLEKFEVSTSVNIYLVAISAGSDILQEFSEIVMKLKRRASKCTLHEVRRFKEDLCKTGALHSYSVCIEGLAKSSVKVVLRVPPDCMAFVLAALTPNFLHAHHLTEVSVNGQHLQVEQEDNGKSVGGWGCRFSHLFSTITYHSMFRSVRMGTQLAM